MAVSGEMAEGAVASALIRGGCTVLFPFGQGQPYDLVVDRGGAGFVRIQVKTAWPCDKCVLFNSCGTDHGRGRQDYRGRAELFGAYAPWLDRVFVIPVAAAASRTTSLRLSPTANRQSRRVNFAEDFRLEHHLDALRPHPDPRSAGAVAA